MEKSEIIEIINKYIKEHEKELVPTHESILQMQKDLTKKSEHDIVGAGKLMILKDKFNFHKACKMQLEQLLEEINKGNK